MQFDDLFNSICCCSCGLCCSKESLCEVCEISTLNANGLPSELATEIKGLKMKSYNYGNGFEYSELYNKLRELIKKQEVPHA